MLVIGMAESPEFESTHVMPASLLTKTPPPAPAVPVYTFEGDFASTANPPTARPAKRGAGVKVAPPSKLTESPESVPA